MSIVAKVVELAHRIRNDAKALAVAANWLGEGLKAVPQSLSEIRATICSKCPNNQPQVMRVEESVAEMVRKQLEVRSLMSIRTSLDSRLFVCGRTKDFPGCGCQLKLKVHVPLSVIPDEPEKFPPHCWQRTERIPPTPTRIHLGEPMGEQAKPQADKAVIRIKRESAFGDVISATVLATKLCALGYKVWWRCCDVVRPALLNHPHIEGFITDPNAPVDVNLDRSYEDNPERKTKDMALLFLEASEHQLKRSGFPVVDKSNRIPHLALTEAELQGMRNQLASLKGRIVAFIPRSAHWPSRTLSEESIVKSAELIQANVIWAYPGNPPSPKFTKILLPTFRHLMALIALSDVVVSTDTGPLHVAAAFNKPIVVIGQAIDPKLRLSYQTDWTEVSADLDCVPCGDFTCRIDRDKPPCQKVPGELIANAVHTKLAAIVGDKVSVIIPVYKNHPRLIKCVESVDYLRYETVVAFDGDAKPQFNGPINVPSPGKRTGFGKTCMRGAHASTGAFLLFLNDDCYLKPGCVQAMLKTMKKHPKCAVVGAQLWYPDGTLQHGGTTRMNGDIGFGHIDWKQRIPTLKGEHEMEFVTFACALVRRSAFYEVRGFDEEFDVYCEDSDLCLRLRQAGWKVFYNANAKAIHDESQTAGPMKAQLHAAAQKIFQRKWTRYFHHNPATA